MSLINQINLLAKRVAAQFKSLHAVATSGSYSDLKNKPTIPSIKNMKGATASAAGSAGYVPAPAAGKQTQFLRGDGTWATPANTTYKAATSTTLGLVKVGSNITNTSGTISLTKVNVTSALGYTPPTKDTTYVNMVAATSNAAGKAGLVPAPAAGAQGKFLRGDGTWQSVLTSVPATSVQKWATDPVTYFNSIYSK